MAFTSREATFTSGNGADPVGPGMMISHQELIVLLSYQEHRYSAVVLSEASRSILLLQEHVRGMKCAESLFQQIFLSDSIPTELHLRGDSEQRRIVISHGFEIPGILR